MQQKSSRKPWGKILLTLLLTLWMLPMTSGMAEASADVISFGDAVLEQAVRKALNLPEGDVTVRDAESLEWLDASLDQETSKENRIQDISALAAFVNLNGLNLSNNNIQNLDALQGLTKLRELYLLGNECYDLSPLAKLTALEKLQVNCYDRDMSFLGGLTELVELDVGGCVALPPELVKLQKLKTFCAAGGALEDISLLAQLPNLTAVNISWNLVSDLTPLADLPLTELYIAGDPVTDFTPIANMVNHLQGLDFDIYLATASLIPETPLEIADANLEQALRNAMGITDRPITLRDAYAVGKLEIQSDLNNNAKFTDITPLSAFANLYSLNISDNQVSDISPLAGMKNLSWINLRNNAISDLTPLSGLSSLTDVFLEGNPIADVTPLTYLANLRILYLNTSPTCDYSPLDALAANLQETNLVVIPDDVSAEAIPMPDAALEAIIRKITGIQDREITYRDVYRVSEIQAGVENMWSEVSDLTSISAFVNLNRLAIFGSKVSDLKPLIGLDNLQVLIIYESPLSDLSPLLQMKQLRQLELVRDGLTDVTVIGELTDLGYLDVSKNNITDLSPLKTLDKLAVLLISQNLTDDASAFADIAPGLKNKDFDPDKPMETASPQGQETVQTTNGGDGSYSPGQYQPANPDEVIVFKDKKLEKAVRAILGNADQPITKGEAAKVMTLDFTTVEGGDAKFTDISPLSEFKNLEELRLVGNKLKNMTALTDLTNLRRLQLDGQSISDLSPLSGMIYMDYLSLKNSKISKLEPLATMSEIRALDLSGNKIKDLSWLSQFTGLEGLYLADNQISDLTPLAGLTQLQSLFLNHNKIKDITALAGMTQLRELMLSGNKIKDYGPVTEIYPTLQNKDFELE